MKYRTIDKAIKAASKRLPFKSEKAQNEMLEYAAGSLAEAYRIGAEEAQTEIIGRLRKIAADESSALNRGAGHLCKR